MATGRMTNILSSLFRKIANDIDTGNSVVSEEEEISIIETINRLSNKEERLSKYSSYTYLNVSRATFDSYIRMNKLPKGEHKAGFKELSWSKKDLDKFIKNNR